MHLPAYGPAFLRSSGSVFIAIGKIGSCIRSDDFGKVYTW